MRRLLYSLICLMLLPLTAAALEVKVEIRGLDRDLETNARAFLSIEQEKDRKGLSEARVRLLNDKAPGEIRKALQPFGYFKPRIKSTLKQQDGVLTARYKVDPGPRVKLSKVDYQVIGEGAGDDKVPHKFPLAVGDVLDLTRYDKAKQSLLSQVVGLGYLDAQYSEHEVKVFRFGEIQFKQDVMDPAFLARYLSFGAGDPYSHEKLLDLQSKLIDSEYFSSVEIDSLRDQAQGDRIPVDVLLKPNKRNRYRIGLGFATDTGPRLTLDWKKRRIGREGHRINSQLRLSQAESSLSSEYTIPLERPTVDYLSFGASVNYYDAKTNKGNRALLSATHSIGLERGWRRTLTLGYLFEDYEIGNQKDSATLLVPGVAWSRIKSESRGGAIRHGIHVELRAEGAADAVLSSTNYFQLYTTDKYIHAFNDDWRVLARFELGATWADSLAKLPPSKRFFAGGDNSVRGFGYEALGPRDDSGEVVGGRYLAVGSLELERHLFGKWSVATFIDAGNAYDPNYHSEAAKGAGVGVRWRSPVGPIRFDLARGHYLNDYTWRLHVVLGPEL
ncbi:MAG: autotransporter assembly complex protein TamA [Candidatus Thiodiazotropha sp.]